MSFCPPLLITLCYLFFSPPLFLLPFLSPHCAHLYSLSPSFFPLSSFAGMVCVCVMERCVCVREWGACVWWRLGKQVGFFLGFGSSFSLLPGRMGHHKGPDFHLFLQGLQVLGPRFCVKMVSQGDHLIWDARGLSRSVCLLFWYPLYFYLSGVTYPPCQCGNFTSYRVIAGNYIWVGWCYAESGGGRAYTYCRKSRLTGMVLCREWRWQSWYLLQRVAMVELKLKWFWLQGDQTSAQDSRCSHRLQ